MGLPGLWTEARIQVVTHNHDVGLGHLSVVSAVECSTRQRMTDVVSQHNVRTIAQVSIRLRLFVASCTAGAKLPASVVAPIPVKGPQSKQAPGSHS